ncbi:MAG: hypothetical protein IJW75_02765, partial [Alphaproteobacteria bacterium]|nr:hypothetical protein [Alphaproteobacteria bacterium]
MVNKTLSKINQKGSMLVEAMAMLALIALVTPTLYKKSAERTTELQDINTATHIRTLAKAVDNYVSTYYNELLANELQGDDAIKELDMERAEDLDKLVNFLPYGYSFDNLKNFGKPKITIKKQGDTRNVTSFVQLPKKIDIGEMRAARIASMVGTNGGYVDNSSAVKGVGGAWGLTSDKLEGLKFDKTTGSLVVASIEAINDASLGHIDDDQYLKRVIDTNDPRRNEMATNLSMGNNYINNISQLIVGAGAAGNGEALYIKENGAYIGGNTNITGSATIGTTLDALGGAFSVYGSADNPILALGPEHSEYLYADSTSVSMQNGALQVAGGDQGYVYATKDTFIDGSLSVGATKSGEYLSAHGGENGGQVALMNSSLTATNSDVTVGVDFSVEGTSTLKGKTTIGNADSATAQAPGFIEDNNKFLTVNGNTSIAGDLEANTIYGNTIDFLNLKAGGEKDNKHRWLQADSTGVTVDDHIFDKTNNPYDTHRLEINEDTTVIAGKGDYTERSKLDLGATNAILEGVEELQLRTTKDVPGTDNDINGVNIQDGAIVAYGKPNADSANNVDINASNTSVNTGDFRIDTTKDNTDDDPQFQVASTTTGEGIDTTTRIKTDKLEITGNEYLRVAETDVEGEGEDKTTPKTRANIATNKVVFSHLSGTSVNPILEVDITGNVVNNNEEGTDNNNMASVYIRKGSIEVEHNPQGAGSLADTGMGYVEAGRFVSNALDTDGKSLATPYVAGAGDEGKEGIGDYYTGETADYDRYMVNPAYTSVMHDIKLTTRGGARLSDILPDFINKGIYVVTNTYQDNINVNQLMPDVVGGQVVASGAEENVMGEKGYAGVNRWASEFLGIVPAPLCPPGYAKVITITPAGFKMAQAGRMLKTTMNNPYGGREDRFYIDIGESANITNMANAYDSL